MTTASGVRVECTLENASGLISGVHFAPVPGSDPVVMLSEPVAAEQADIFCSIPGYRLAQTTGAKALAAVDAAIADAKRIVAEQPAAPGTSASQTIEELQRANLAMTAERDQLRVDLAAARAQAEGKPPVDAQTEIALRVEERDKALRALADSEGERKRLKAENDQLRQANDALTSKGGKAA